MNCAIKKDDVGVYATSCTSPKRLMAFFTMVLRKQFENIEILVVVKYRSYSSVRLVKLPR